MFKNALACLLAIPLTIATAVPALANQTYYKTYNFEPFDGNDPQTGVVSFGTEVINAAVVIQSFDADPFEVGGSEVVSVEIQNVNISGDDVTFEVVMETTDGSIPKSVKVAIIAEAR